MSLTGNQVAALRELEEVWPQASAVIIGATALGFYYDTSRRQTADVDLAVAVELEEFPGALPDRPGWSQHSRKEHEFTSPQGVRLDILPAGRVLLDVGEVHWQSGHVMSLAGMDLAFERAISVWASPVRGPRSRTCSRVGRSRLEWERLMRGGR